MEGIYNVLNIQWSNPAYGIERRDEWLLTPQQKDMLYGQSALGSITQIDQ